MNEISVAKQAPSIITVIGVGGAGGNALNYMWDLRIKDVNFLACNTDAKALDNLRIPAENKIILGKSDDPLYGLGAGNNPAKGRAMATASLDIIRQYLEAKGTKMVFIAAGMGGGTGTGAAPVIAKLTHEMGLLTVANVTSPSLSEGPSRCNQANEGIEELRKYADSLLVVNNDSIRQQFGKLPITKAFSKADDVLASATKGIAEIITVKSAFIRVDYADLERVMRGSGRAHMGVAQASGEGRALEAARRSLCSPLLDSNLIAGAKKILINISAKSADDMTFEEAQSIVDYIQAYASYRDEDGVEHRADIIWGASSKDVLPDDTIEVVVVATGFSEESAIPKNTFPAIADTIELVSEKEIEPIEDKSPLAKPIEVNPSVAHRFNGDMTATLDKRPSKYINMDAVLNIPGFKRHNVGFMPENNTASSHKATLRIEPEEEENAMSGNGRLFN